MSQGSVADARERVLEFARETERLSKSDLPPATFFPEFLRLLVGALGADAAAMWMLNPQRQVELQAEVRLAETELHGDTTASERNRQIVGEVLSHGQAKLVSPDANPENFPAQNLLIFASVHDGQQPVGVVEVFQRSDVPSQARAGYLQFAEQMCGFASRYLERRQKAQPSSSSAAPMGLVEELADFVLRLQRAVGLKETAATAASDGRLFLGCDRLSLAVRRGKKTIIQATSGQDSVNQRANLTRAMAKLAAQCIASGEPLTFSGKVEDLPPQLEKPLADFAQESGARLVVLLPLFEPKPHVDPNKLDEVDQQAQHVRKAVGCLVVEQMSDGSLEPAMKQRIDLMVDHVAAALFQSLQRERIVLLPVQQAVGRSLEWFTGRKLWKTLAILSVLGAIGASLALVPWDYRVEGEGFLMPVEKREVFAPSDGDVIRLFVQSGDRVAEGQPLVELKNDDLRTELLRVQTELSENRELAGALQIRSDAMLSDPTQDAERAQLDAQRVETLAKIAGLERHEKVLTERVDQLTVRAPLAGVVATFQVEQLLGDRPVRRGETLVEVMNDTGPWQLELKVEEHRLGHILRAQERLGTEQLPVEYILASSVVQTFNGQLQTIATRTAQSSESGSVVEVFASLDEHGRPVNRRIGAEVRAKISCGERSLGYVLFGDVIEFVQKYFWL